MRIKYKRKITQTANLSVSLVRTSVYSCQYLVFLGGIGF